MQELLTNGKEHCIRTVKCQIVAHSHMGECGLVQKAPYLSQVFGHLVLTIDSSVDPDETYLHFSTFSHALETAGGPDQKPCSAKLCSVASDQACTVCSGLSVRTFRTILYGICLGFFSLKLGSTLCRKETQQTHNVKTTSFQR